MTAYEHTAAKMQQLPEPLLQEVSDFIDFLLVKHDQTQWEVWTHFRESLHIAESDFADYLHNLETYDCHFPSFWKGFVEFLTAPKTSFNRVKIFNFNVFNRSQS